MRIIFDIETVRAYDSLDHAPQQYRDAWGYTAKNKLQVSTVELNEGQVFADDALSLSYLDKAGLFPEYGRIICISAINDQDKKIISFSSEDNEQSILVDFCDYVGEYREQLIGHSIKYFDIPYIVTRLAAHSLKIPPSFQQYGVKPWESNIIDTHDVWKCGFYSTTNAGSLPAICNALGIESPKDEISGADVANVFYQYAEHGFSSQGDALIAIATYCEKDVRATAAVFNHMKKVGMI